MSHGWLRTLGLPTPSFQVSIKNLNLALLCHANLLGTSISRGSLNYYSEPEEEGLRK